MAVYAIGDVQGCDGALDALLKRIHFSPDRDVLWFAGDIVNRGPQSLAALRRVHSLRDNSIVVLGNHDLHLLAVARGSGRRMHKGDTLEEILGAPDREVLLDWLQARPLLHHDAQLGFTILHGGLAPQWTLEEARAATDEFHRALLSNPTGLYDNMYGDQPSQWSPDLQGYDRLRFIVNCLTRMRFCDLEGRFDLKIKEKPDKAPPPYLPWFRVPGRRTSQDRIVCGHWSALGLHQENNVFAIDTGCVWGDCLTALRLDELGEPVQVRC